MISRSPWAPSRTTEWSAFQLSDDRIHLNHGSYGAVPRAVQAAQERWRKHMESDPTSFFQNELPGLMRAQANHVAMRFGGAGKDWVFCENATAAVNGVLASLPLSPGDEIVTSSHVYGAVLKAMRLCAGRRGAKLVIAELPAIAQSDEAIVEAIARRFTAKTRLLIVDHITSATATVFPVAAIAARAKAAGIPVLVDGAHAPGQVPLDVPALGADWYTGNAHKWFFAPRGCGLLWTTPARQAQTRPPVLSHGTEAGYTEAFDWIGTRDVTPWLVFEDAARAHDSFGGPDLMDANRRKAAEGSALICEALGTVCAAPPSMRAAMATILIKENGADEALQLRLRQALWTEYKVIAPLSLFAGRLWLRVSAQVYTHPDDYRLCRDAILELRSRF
ncbi:MAG TPA: aminotransferase class V-fold PLP-dependent enzyme [Rhizomicrobium sp.]|jgi:isopenicillin-N epimerase